MTEQRHLGALVVGAILCVTLLPPSTAEGSGGLLATFPHGSPEDARWTMLKLEVTQPGVVPTVVAPLQGSVCPFVWSFQFLTGTPDDAVIYNGVTINLGNGHGGAEAYAIGPAGWTTDAAVLTQDHNGLSCMDMTWTLIFGELPVGTVYMLEYLAGSDFASTATLSVDHPGVTIVGRSSGDDVVYLDPRDFEGGTHVGVYSPPSCAPLGFQADGSCGTWWTGGEAGGVVVNDDRHATIHFEHHPLFQVTTGVHGEDSGMDVSNITVTDPAGAVMSNVAGADAEVAGLNVNGRGFGIMRTKNVPAGAYDVRLEGASVGILANPQWHVYGVDAVFPEELVT